MQAKYEALTQCLSEATVAPNSVTKQLDYMIQMILQYNAVS